MRIFMIWMVIAPLAVGCQDPDASDDGDVDVDVDVDGDGDGVAASVDCDDSDPTMHTICLMGEQTYVGPFELFYELIDSPATCSGEISMVVEYPSDPDSFPTLKSSAGWCTGMASEMDDIDLTHLTEFTSFFDVNGGLADYPCEIPWVGELSPDGTKLTGVSDEVECDTGSVWGPSLFSYAFSASLQIE